MKGLLLLWFLIIGWFHSLTAAASSFSCPGNHYEIGWFVDPTYLSQRDAMNFALQKIASSSSPSILGNDTLSLAVELADDCTIATAIAGAERVVQQFPNISVRLSLSFFCFVLSS
jgi:hypothetical protein